MAPTAKVAAVQAAYVLMDQQATVAKATAMLETAAAAGAEIVVFPEVFIPGTPIWFDSGRIWHGDEQWYAMLSTRRWSYPARLPSSSARRPEQPAATS